MDAPAPVLLFVCSANTCRSPMAAAIASLEAQRRGMVLTVRSAGTSTKAGYPAAANAQEVLAEIGLSAADHRSAPVTREMIDAAALVVALTGRHRDMLRQFFTHDAAKIVSFGDLTVGQDVADPIGGSLDDFRATRDFLRTHMPAIIAAIDRQGPAIQPRERAR